MLDPVLTQEQLDLALEPAYINTNVGPEYSDEARNYAMVIGTDRTPKGRIWAAWVAGGDNDLGYFVLAYSDNRGRNWSRPLVVIDPANSPTGLRRRVLVGNLWTDPTGKLWLFYDQSLGYFDGRAGVWTITCDNPDAAQPIWSPPRRIWHGATLNKPTVLSSGEWLLPVSLWNREWIKPDTLTSSGLYPELDDQRMAHVFCSVDEGETWTRQGGVRVPASKFDEHMIVELRDHRLWLLARTYYGIAESFSQDHGRTWSEPQPSRIRHTTARFFIRRLASGRILLVKHGCKIEEHTEKRSHLTAFVSEDDGQTWLGGLLLDERTQVSYPDGFEAPDGLIHIIYDHNRATDSEILMTQFREEDVLAGGWISPDAHPQMMVNKALG